MERAPREHAEALLVKAARAYGVPVAKGGVQKALDDPSCGTALVEWANMHLGQDTLLTADELALYAALDRAGQADRLADANDLGEVQAVSEDHIRAAIEELNRSTATINKHTETLRQQQDALSRLVRKRGENQAQRRNLEDSRLRKNDIERNRLIADVEAVSQSVSFRVADLEQQAEDSKEGLSKVVDGTLQSDDKLLSSLQKLGLELDQQGPEDEKDAEKMREVCTRLIKVTVETLRTRLDRIYLEATIAAENSGDSRPASAEEVKALEEELESLYSEILPVAQMSTEQQHLEPAMQSTQSQSGQSIRRSAAAVTYISQCLDYLLERIGILKDRIETLISHEDAATAIVATAKKEVAAPVTKPSQQQAQEAIPGSPVRSRSNTTTSTRRKNRRRSSGLQDEVAMEALLRNLALTLPPPGDATAAEQAAMLAKIVADRTASAGDIAKSSQDSFERSAVKQLDDARLAIQLLRDSILAESPYSEVKLVDPEIEGSIHFLVQEVDKVKTRLDGVGSHARPSRSEKKGEFIERWGA